MERECVLRRLTHASLSVLAVFLGRGRHSKLATQAKPILAIVCGARREPPAGLDGGGAPWLLSGARTSPSFADVLEQPKFVCACFVVFPSGGLRVRVILFEISCCLFLLVSDTVHNF